MARLALLSVLAVLICAVELSTGKLPIADNIDQSQPLTEGEDDPWADEEETVGDKDCPNGKIVLDESPDGLVVPVCVETTTEPAKSNPPPKKSTKVTFSGWPTHKNSENGEDSAESVEITVARHGLARCCGWECLLRAIVVNTCSDRCSGTKNMVNFYSSKLVALASEAHKAKKGACVGRVAYCLALAAFLNQHCGVAKEGRHKRDLPVEKESVEELLARVRRTPSRLPIAHDLENTKVPEEFNNEFQAWANTALPNANGMSTSRQRRSTVSTRKHHHSKRKGHMYFSLWNQTESTCCHSPHGCSESFFTGNMCNIDESELHRL